jgi:transposase
MIVFMAPKTIMPNPENSSLKELDVAARAAANSREHNRLMAIKALLIGADRDLITRLHNIAPRTLQNWIRRFNARGIDGLIDAPKPGRSRAIPRELAPVCADLIENPAKAGQQHWTGVKFHGHLTAELQLKVGYSTVIRFLHEQNFTLKVPQPWPDRQDETLRQAFRETIRRLMRDLRVELWFADESGFEGDPRPRRRWARKGEKTRATKNGDHVRMNVTGMICPRTGAAYLLEFSHSDTDTFQAFLNQANQDLTLDRPRNLIVLDNASWHKAKRLDWGRFEPLFLPPYSPDFNPIERLWLLIKAEWFSDFIAKDRQQLIDRLDQALNWAVDRAQLNQKTCSMRKFL